VWSHYRRLQFYAQNADRQRAKQKGRPDCSGRPFLFVMNVSNQAL
jgi:hypothetical protein